SGGLVLRPPPGGHTWQAEGTEAEAGAEGEGRIGAGGWAERPRPDHGDGGAGAAGHGGVVSEGHRRPRPRGGLASRLPPPEASELGGKGGEKISNIRPVGRGR